MVQHCLTLPLSTTAAPKKAVALRIRLHGLKGGHSGVDIHLQRGNATKLLARALYAISLETPLQLADIEGGNKHNAIPREAFATVVVDAGSEATFTQALEREFAAFREEYRPAEPNMQLEVSKAKAPAQVWDEATTGLVLRLLDALPHGVLGMSYDIPELVETSTNLATVAELAGAEVEEGNGYPGWKPNLESHVLKTLKQVHQKELGTEPEIKAIHAGLECGLIGEKVPGMDMASFGPQIEFPHSPDERVKIDSVDRFYRVITATLEALA
jgi:dipeptidase D